MRSTGHPSGAISVSCTSWPLNQTILDHCLIHLISATRFIIGLSVAIPAASLCINRRLYIIASVRTVTVSKAEKRRAIMVDLAIGLGIPLLEMILQYIVQGHRFNIFEDVGCYPVTWNTTPAYPLVFCWPVAIGLVSAVYCCESHITIWCWATV